MTLRCTIDIEATDCDHLRRILGVAAAPEPPVVRMSNVEALKIVCWDLATARVRRNKIEAIKRFRELTGQPLKESKDAVETLDCAYLFPNGGV